MVRSSWFRSARWLFSLDLVGGGGVLGWGRGGGVLRGGHVGLGLRVDGRSLVLKTKWRRVNKSNSRSRLQFIKGMKRGNFIKKK